MLLSEHGSAKEVIISAQEALERLENTEIECDDTYLSPFDQLMILIDVYASGKHSETSIYPRLFMKWS